jgi:Transglutaminase-like superfamily
MRPRLAIRAEAHVIAAAVRIVVRLLPLPRIVALLARLPRAHRPVGTTVECASAVADAVRRAAHPTCLFTALTAFALLARRGHEPRFVLGAANDRGFDAHAWVTVRGVPVIPCTREYVPLWSYGTSPAEAI